jgi:metal-responsive CopG/Arc/MetJ family transcriptional regulator
VASRAVRITIVLTKELLKAVDQAVREGKAASRNELISVALRHELAALKRAKIDAAFTKMAQDRDYQEEAQGIVKEFAVSDWEAFQQGEGRDEG